MSTAIHVIVRYTIKDGQHDRYEAWKQGQTDAASEPGSGVLAYEFYRDETGVCVHRDSYVDEASAFEFLKNKAAIEEWLQIADPIDTLLLGDVRDEARAGLPRTTTAYSTVQGFTR
ncbi:hypothetical protein [Streptomyces sp. NPDC050704]|uniref:putative quinol monooxygenase n=1 Tax=Streptomyces sp. NPDC050704 TaxID=3157219 RepID=UPI0034432EB8